MTAEVRVTNSRDSLKKGDFPPDFLWGTATASYQIEGAAQEDGRLPSIWDTFSHTPGKVKGGDTGDIACDHYHLWRADLDLMRELGLNAYRFSVAWPRVVPQGRGPVNSAGLDFYDRLTDGLLERGLRPFVTLYHWDLPQLLQDEGGWAARDTAPAFADYVDLVARRLGDRVDGWITHNEPFCAAFLGYLRGSHAPGQNDLEAALRASHHLLLSHGLATRALRAAVPRARIGVALNLPPIHAASESPDDQAAARRLDGFVNRWFLDPLYGRGYPRDMMEWYRPRASGFERMIERGDLEAIAVPTDFLGVNYYHNHVVRRGTGDPLLELDHVWVDGEHTALNWGVHPDGLREMLTRLERDYRPGAIYVTENGAAYRDEVGPDGGVEDEERRLFIEKHLLAARDAILEGAPLKGFFIWSFIDNFEWAEGYDSRFGLVRVDYASQRRTVKASGNWVRRLIRG